MGAMFNLTNSYYHFGRLLADVGNHSGKILLTYLQRRGRFSFNNSVLSLKTYFYNQSVRKKDSEELFDSLLPPSP